MRTIYKYPFQIKNGEQKLRIPWGYKIIKIDLDPMGAPCIWTEVDSKEKFLDTLYLVVCGTGHEIPQDFVHIGSFVQGSFVWHCYSLIYHD